MLLNPLLLKVENKGNQILAEEFSVGDEGQVEGEMWSVCDLLFLRNEANCISSRRFA